MKRVHALLVAGILVSVAYGFGKQPREASRGWLGRTGEVVATEAAPVRPEHGQALVKRVEKTEHGYRLRRSATGTRYWERLPVDTEAHPEILSYRIQWFNGRWSKEFFPGDGDTDWKENGTRRVWCYFDDHSHEIFLAPEALEMPLWRPLLTP